MVRLSCVWLIYPACHTVSYMMWLGTVLTKQHYVISVWYYVRWLYRQVTLGWDQGQHHIAHNSNYRGLRHLWLLQVTVLMWPYLHTNIIKIKFKKLYVHINFSAKKVRKCKVYKLWLDQFHCVFNAVSDSFLEIEWKRIFFCRLGKRHKAVPFTPNRINL